MFLWFKRLRLLRRRTVWCPTLLGLFCTISLLAAPVVWWCISGESFLSSTRRLPAEILVVEGWIGSDGVRAAATEFGQRGYKYVVAAGGVATARGWGQAGWSYAEGADHELIRSGVPEERIIFAPSRRTETQRTYESAVAVSRAFEARGVHPKALNVFTLGPHVRRSCLVFAKVLGPGTEVGGVSWTPSDLPWWRSSDRAKDLLTETAGYVYEAFFNSGRSSNSPGNDTFPDIGQHGALGTKVADP
jgi:uncharacterized SAM-binding protein YcdF (DUF218 family)